MGSKRLIPGKPYIPNAGVNFDANSLVIKDAECNSIENLRVLPYELRTRDGSRRLASNVPSGDPVLHFHTYKRPNASEILFAFTKKNVFKLTSTTWSLAQAKNAITFTDDTNWTASGTNNAAFGVAVNTDGYTYAEGFWTTGVPQSPAIALGEKVLTYGNMSAQDLSVYDRISFRVEYFCDDGLVTPIDHDDVWTIKFCSDVAGATVIQSATFTLLGGNNRYPENFFQQVDIALPTPASLTSIRSITFHGPDYQSLYGYSVTFAVSSPIDVYADLVPNNVTFWSTCDFVDLTKKSSVVAAGSSPPTATDSESDGANRVLLYYDITLGYFRTLTISSDITINDEATSADGGGAGQGPFSGTTANVGAGIIPFTFFLRSGGLLVRDNGSGNLSGDGSGTINYTTGAWTVTFTTGVGSVLVDYAYKATYVRKPRYVRNLNNRVIMANVYEDTTYMPWRIRWSDVGDMATVRGTSYRDLLDDDISSISALAYSGEYLIVYRHDSVVKMRAIGGSSVFGFFTVWQYGTFATGTVFEWNNYNFFLGKDDVYKFDGQQFSSIATQRVRNQIFNRLNKDKIQNCFSSYDDQYKEYWLWIVRAGNTYPTDVFVYSLQYDTWSFFTFPEISAVGMYFVTNTRTWNQLVGSWNQQQWRWKDGNLEGTVRVPVMARYGGDVFVTDYRLVEDFVSGTSGTPIAWSLVTKDFIAQTLEHKDRMQRVHFEAKGHQVTVSNSCTYSQDITTFGEATTIPLSSQQDEHQYWPDMVHEHIRLGFSGVGAFSLRWIQPFSVTQEKD